MPLQLVFLSCQAACTARYVMKTAIAITRTLDIVLKSPLGPGPGFDLVAQGEVGARVERVCGGEVLTQLGDGGGGASGW
jgi:hypothetical protein